MTGVHLICLPIDMVRFHRWSAARSLALDEGRALHHLLGESFGKGVMQPFRLMVPPGAVTGSLYAYSPDDAATLTETAAACGLPDALAVCDPAGLASKQMPPTWTEGRRLAFDLRVRPVRRLRSAAGVFPKGAEVDAFLAEALRKFPDGRPRDDAPDRATVYREWLVGRMAGAARIEEARIARFERRTVSRGETRREGPDVTFHGELTILDAALFTERLVKGVGRHTAYGYGMILLRPARR
ncbi:MAG: type I-E CRISPR-associated protein Cas6/Cse3/CasE [Telmatospirillum sp.]|nr:type I-E CRISPR-associated protein Cas6/Cse3/CasE [Telmatospirillum sp.]